MLMGDDVPSWVDFVMQNASLPVLEDRGQAEAGSDDGMGRPSTVARLVLLRSLLRACVSMCVRLCTSACAKQLSTWRCLFYTVRLWCDI